MKEAEKLNFIIGFDESIYTIHLITILYLSIIPPNSSFLLNDKDLKDNLTKNVHNLYKEKTTYKQEIDFLNKFYSNPQYRIIPIYAILSWLYFSLSEEEIIKQDEFAAKILKLLA